MDAPKARQVRHPVRSMAAPRIPPRFSRVNTALASTPL